MATHSTRRHRSSTAASTSSEGLLLTSELRPLIEVLQSRLRAGEGIQIILEQTETLQRVRQCLTDAPGLSKSKDIFRQLRGFETLVYLLQSLSSIQPKSQDEQANILGLLRTSFTILSYVLSEHNGNRRYFVKRVENGGWNTLEKALNDLVFLENGVYKANEKDYSQFAGSLLAFTLGQDSIWPTFSTSRRILEAASSSKLIPDDTSGGDTVNQDDFAMRRLDEEEILEQAITESTLDDIHDDDRIQNPEMVPILFKTWLAFTKAGKAHQASLSMIIALRELTASSKSNLLAVHGSGILSNALEEVLSGELPIAPFRLLRGLVELLMSNGIANLDDGYNIFRKSMDSLKSAELLLMSIKKSRVPSYIQFDLSIHGYSSIELPTINQSFPPASSSAGYTSCAWIYIDKFDDTCHTTLFGAFDRTQTCFVLVYIEKKTQNLILQTSIRTSRPSIRFKSTTFERGRWYHIALVHRRPRTISSSRAILFVDGEYKEQIKCAYPISPPTAAADKHSSSRDSSSVMNPIQTFLGTPQDLALRLGKGVVTTCWSLASAHLFGESLSEDLLAVYYRLGPRYSGNYQDCLGSFQTYEASAALNMRNELHHPGKEEKSDIVAAIRSKASLLMPEKRIFLNIAPESIMDDNDNNNIDESQLIKSLSKSSAKSLFQWTQLNGNVIAINGAIPCINEALTQPHGVAILTGNPSIVIPKSLDDVSWKVGGCVPVCLKIIEAARSREAVLLAAEILLESINKSWRNSEAMERQHGFGILGGLLRGKMGAGNVIASSIPGASSMIEGGPDERDKLSFGLLSIVLGFVGYCHSKPDDSIIVNQLAYRVLLVDFDMWRKSGTMTQRLYYKQFEIFGQVSNHHEFNSRRMMRMRIVKKLIEAIKGEPVPDTILPDFMSAMKTLVMNNPSAEVLRSLALFVTYSLHKPVVSTSRTLRGKQSNLSIQEHQRNSSPLSKPSRSHASPGRSMDGAEVVPQKELAIRILELYADILCNDASTLLVKKFARTVTNKWLLYLLVEDDPRVIMLGAKIIARLLIIHGKSYVEKFATKTGGFVIMQHRLKRWWNVSTIWPICFAILFNVDVRQLDFERPFDLYNLLDMFSADEKTEVVNPGIIPVIMSLLSSGLQAIVRDEDDPESPSASHSTDQNWLSPAHPVRPKHARKRSMSLGAEIASIETAPAPTEKLKENALILHTVSQFLTDLHAKSESFRDYTVSSNFVQELLFVLFPVIVSSDGVSAETELQSRNSGLTFEGSDVVIKSSSHTGNSREAPIIRTTLVEAPPSPRINRARPVRRGSSFVLITSLHEKPQGSSSSTRSRDTGVTKQANTSNSVIEGLLEIVILVFIELVMERKDFPGFGLFLKVPPGFQEHQAYFNTYILRNTLSHLDNTLQLNQKLLCEPKILTNLARFTSHLTEALSEGWFLNGAEPILDFIGTILEYLQRPDVAKVKSVRLCSQAIQNIRSVFMRVVLLRLSELDDSTKMPEDVVAFLDKILYWQTVILSPENTEGQYLKLMCYLMYTKLIDPRDLVRFAAANLWRMTLVQKPEETTDILDSSTRPDQKPLSNGFKKLMELDNETFLYWIDNNRKALDALFFGSMSKAWEEYVSEARRKIDDMIKSRVVRRKEKLKQWATEDMANEDTYRRHEVASGHWVSNISASEHVKYLRALQDMQDDYTFIVSKFSKMDRDLRRPCGLLDDHSISKWQLDQTEGRNRMRMRLLIDETVKPNNYQPKRRQSSNTRVDSLKVASRTDSSTSIESISTTPTAMNGDGPSDQPHLNGGRSIVSGPFTEEPEQEEFELVDGPQDNQEVYEDKNRKVIRALQRGDQIQQVYNISRIIGLDFCEGLLILGKDSLYLLDNFFQRSDGEIVNVNQAAKEERDSYLQMISGRENKSSKPRSAVHQQDSRNWRWKEVLSFSKRRFLFRDVAIEVFFTDGRSYLLTAMSSNLRNDLYSKLMNKAPQVAGSAPLSSPEDAWRLEALRAHDEVPQGLGSKIANVFGPAYSNPATRKWAKGEISNFNYLMLVNTMAGRTFNDLTQYPVFPWVLADYSSEELDLTDPRSFRDLTKPMGCQTSEREAEFRERYQSFAEMGDHNAPPFHYGTHYSSAMIVTSYLIRLQPFVQSYLLLQGGTFDHPDRLFYSIEKAWSSASRNNMTDVRELIPEFFYLPEFLTNSNNFNFGVRQGTGERIDTVALPPWAKGDPKIFIAKHREALESPFVSQHLHQWIDLIFGFKQKGEAAIEATNVFNYLSYQGAKDLDRIEDSLERLATIGIIHNFGQTPYQVFTKGHPAREETGHKFKRLDTAAESLTRLPFPLLETTERVSSMIFSVKQDRLLCSAAFRLNIPPIYDKYMEWGFVDGSVRFYNAENRKLIGLFEHVHQGQLSVALFADSRTLVTSGTDCTISIWTIITEPKTVDLQPRSTLFGHRKPVTVLAISRSLSALLSASLDGVVLLWDLNRLEFVRKLCHGLPLECARINDITGNILLCSGQTATMYTLNGSFLLSQKLCDDADDYIASCAFYEGSGNEWLEREIIFTGHRRGVVNVWNKTIKDGAFVLELIKVLNHLDRLRPDGGNVSAAITCILPMPQTIYTGDEDGVVQEWNCVQRSLGGGK